MITGIIEYFFIALFVLVCLGIAPLIVVLWVEAISTIRRSR